MDAPLAGGGHDEGGGGAPCVPATGKRRRLQEGKTNDAPFAEGGHDGGGGDVGVMVPAKAKRSADAIASSTAGFKTRLRELTK
jgi:hypothetical protein